MNERLYNCALQTSTATTTVTWKRCNGKYTELFLLYTKAYSFISRVCMMMMMMIVQYAVLEAMTRVYGKTENSSPRKYKMDKDIQTPPRIYNYVVELSCCAQSEQNQLTQFCWGNWGSLSFLLTHTHNQSNKFYHLAYRSQIWKDLKHLWLKTRGFTPRCAFLWYR